MGTVFNAEKYIKMQSQKILERTGRFKKLYLEFGGKLFDDNHMSRCAPGFAPDIKIKMLLSLKDKCEIIFCINADDIEQGKVRHDTGLTYENELLRLIENFREAGLSVNSVVINKYSNQPAAVAYSRKLENLGITSYLFNKIDGYPGNIDHVVSDQGFGANQFIKTTRPLVIITAPGPGSGKLSVSLSQLYNEYKHGSRKAGYAKFETLPVWNLSLRHPLNLAYEASTVNLNDVNMIDSYHYEKYGKVAINYNRDIEAFPLIKNILHKIHKKDIYYSPTDMGVNMVGFCIEDEVGCEKACRQEVLRRYYNTLCANKTGLMTMDAVKKINFLMEQLNIKESERPVVTAARKMQLQTGGKKCISLQLPAIVQDNSDAEGQPPPVGGEVSASASGEIITAPANGLTSAASEVILKTLQKLLKVDNRIKLIPENIMYQTIQLKTNVLGERKFHLQIGEILIILSSSAVTNELSSHAIAMLGRLAGAEAHSTYIISEEEQKIFRKLKINLTQEAVLS